MVFGSALVEGHSSINRTVLRLLSTIKNKSVAAVFVFVLSRGCSHNDLIGHLFVNLGYDIFRDHWRYSDRVEILIDDAHVRFFIPDALFESLLVLFNLFGNHCLLWLKHRKRHHIDV